MNIDVKTILLLVVGIAISAGLGKFLYEGAGLLCEFIADRFRWGDRIDTFWKNIESKNKKWLVSLLDCIEFVVSCYFLWGLSCGMYLLFVLSMRRLGVLDGEIMGLWSPGALALCPCAMKLLTPECD